MYKRQTVDNPDSLAEMLEISNYAESCRFKDCTHTNEPGCAVLEAVAEGSLDAKVYESYLKLKREAWHFSASEHEKRKTEKYFTKLVEEVKRREAASWFYIYGAGVFGFLHCIIHLDM